MHLRTSLEETAVLLNRVLSLVDSNADRILDRCDPAVPRRLYGVTSFRR